MPIGEQFRVPDWHYSCLKLAILPKELARNWHTNCEHNCTFSFLQSIGAMKSHSDVKLDQLLSDAPMLDYP
jgi:hypothetical protein